MEKKIGLAQARKEFSKVINDVQYQGESYIISRHGEEAAAVVPLQVYQNWIEGRENFFNSIQHKCATSKLFKPLTYSTFNYQPSPTKNKIHPNLK